MFVLLPPFCFFLVFQILRKRCESWCTAILTSAIVWATFLTLTTEVLSTFTLITFRTLVLVWAAACFGVYLIYFLYYKKQKPIKTSKIEHSPSVIFLLIVVILIVTIIGVVAIIAAPNNYDSLNYHLSRIMHWIQNHNVAHYPTSIPNQLFQNPFAEFVILHLHLQILSDSDRFANLVQWFSMLGSIIGVSLIAKLLGANIHGQIIAAVVCTTIPMGILQASSTQNDYVVAFWLICFVYYILRLREKNNGQSIIFYSIGAGMSLGLALLTKATAYIFAFPFLVWFVLSSIRTYGSRFWKPILIIVVVVLSINLGHFKRNLNLYGSPLGDEKERARYPNDIFTISAFISNTTRNIGLHLGTPFNVINTTSEKAIYRLHRLLDIDIKDPHTTWYGMPFHVERLSTHEDAAGNLVHLTLIFLTIVCVFVWRKIRKQTNIVHYLFALVGAFAVFSFYLKWQPWHSRLQLPIFVLFSPLIAVVLSRIQYNKFAHVVVGVLILLALPWVLHNQSRPLIGKYNIINTNRTDQYFRNHPEWKDPYIGSTNFLKEHHISQIGLILYTNEWEYPFWMLMKRNNYDFFRIEHVNVKNRSAEKSKIYPFNTFRPNVIISLYSEDIKEVFSGDSVYMKEWSLSPISIFFYHPQTAVKPSLIGNPDSFNLYDHLQTTPPEKAPTQKERLKDWSISQGTRVFTQASKSLNLGQIVAVYKDEKPMHLVLAKFPANPDEAGIFYSATWPNQHRIYVNDGKNVPPKAKYEVEYNIATLSYKEKK